MEHERRTNLIKRIIVALTAVGWCMSLIAIGVPHWLSLGNVTLGLWQICSGECYPFSPAFGWIHASRAFAVVSTVAATTAVIGSVMIYAVHLWASIPLYRIQLGALATTVLSQMMTATAMGTAASALNESYGVCFYLYIVTILLFALDIGLTCYLCFWLRRNQSPSLTATDTNPRKPLL